MVIKLQDIFCLKLQQLVCTVAFQGDISGNCAWIKGIKATSDQTIAQRGSVGKRKLNTLLDTVENIFTVFYGRIPIPHINDSIM